MDEVRIYGRALSDADVRALYDYEFQPDGPGEFIGWLQQYGLPTDGSADFVDSDGDLRNNSQEWQADTNPTNATSVLRIMAVSRGPTVGITVQSSSNRLYTLQYCTDLPVALWAPVPGATDVPGIGGPLTLTDPNSTPVAKFYRVSVRLP
jgi:hypothetical protein